ncbi:MAG: CHAD domain-containing protein [Bradymonadia bacterium]|jgi:CHAD domain-containing protein
MSSYAEAAVHLMTGTLEDAIAALPVTVGDARPCQRIWYDTFDWRLHRGKSMLIHEVSADRTRWLPAGGPVQTRQSAPPRYAADASPALQSDLLPLAQQRALLPRVGVDGIEHTFHKGRVRGGIGRWQAVDPETGVEVELGVLLWLAGPAPAVDALRIAWQLPKRKSLLKQALRALERRPDDYSRRIKISIDPQAPTDQAGRAVLTTLHGNFIRNLPGVIGDLDAEFLKDLRVAVRRTRAALWALRPAWRRQTIEPLEAGLKWLGEVTTPVRDLDVYLQRLPVYQGELPPDLQSALDPFGGLLRTLRAPNQAAMVRALTSPGFAAIHARWLKFLVALAPSTKPAAGQPIGEIARIRTAESYAAVCAEGRAITPESPAESLHALRKTGKKLRYLLEFFRTVHRPALIKPAIKHMRRLQSHLGEFNDVSIQYTALAGHAAQLKACGAPARTGRAVNQLIKQLEAREATERLNFDARWTAFDSPEVQALFATLLAPSDDAGATEA